MNEKSRRSLLFFLVPALSLGIIILGLILSIQAFQRGQKLTLTSQDSQLMKTAQSVDNDIIGHFNWYSSDFCFLIRRSGLDVYQRAWLTGQDDGSSLVAYLKDSPLLQLRGITAMVAVQDDQAILSTDGRLDYTFLTSLGMVGETEVGISRDGDGKLYVSMFLTWEEVDYAILIDGEEFFATTEEQSAAGPNDRLLLLDSTGQYYFHRDQNGAHIHPVAELLETGSDHPGLERLQSAQESGKAVIDFYDIQEGNGDSYTARLVALPASGNINGCFTVGLFNNYDETSRPLQTNFIHMMLCGGLIMLGVLLFLFFILQIRRQSRQVEEELRLLREKAETMEELNRQTQELAHHQRLETIGTLTSSIAHEFNNLLTPIMGYSILILEKIPSQESESYDNALEIYNASRKAKEIIARLSALSRKNTPLTFQPVAPDPLVERVLEVSAAACPKNVTVEKSLACPDVFISGNETQLFQMLLNLVLNAFQALEAVGGTVTVSTFAGAGTVSFRVADNGPGIPEDILPRIFDPFFTTKGSGKGTGLGLAIVRQVAEDHGGTVSAQPGPGACFTVTIPTAPSGEAGKTEE